MKKTQNFLNLVINFMEHRFEEWQEEYKSALIAIKNELKEVYHTEYFEAPEKFQTPFLAALEDCFLVEKEKGKPTYLLCISFLITSVITRSYTLEFRCYNEKGFSDLDSSATYCPYPKLAHLFEEKLDILEKQIKMDCFQVLPYELEEFRKLSSWILYEVFLESFTLLLEDLSFFSCFLEILPKSLCVASYGYLYNHQTEFFRRTILDGEES